MTNQKTSDNRIDDKIFLGIDTGGTFTDFVLIENGKVKVHKVLSTPDSPDKAIFAGISDLDLWPAINAGKVSVSHGSTIATNALLEKKGATTLFICNKGFKDLLTIGRQARPELYNLKPIKTSPLIPEQHCLEVDCRIDAQGKIIKDLSNDELITLQQKISDLAPDAISVCFLFSFLNPVHEQQIKDIIPEHIFLTCSSEVLPVIKEYERGLVSWLNSSFGPLIKNYLMLLEKRLQPSTLEIMQSFGGTCKAQQAADRPINLLLSGPAGGLAGANYIRKLSERKRLLTFDMGGTSTDIGIIENGISLTNEANLGGYPIAMPMVEMQTIGAGGGSIAFIDEGGLLQVGPESSGANPGPACYGNGGSLPTVSDANLVLGKLQTKHFLGGRMLLDLDRANEAILPLAEKLGMTNEALAQGIVDISHENICRAIKQLSTRQGHDPQEFVLTCFGGAGGLHVCDLAEKLNINEALIPVHSGVLSALGMIAAEATSLFSQSLICLVSDLNIKTIEEIHQQQMQQGLIELKESGIEEDDISFEKTIELRYRGQNYSLKVSWASELEKACEDFHKQHEKRYGFRYRSELEIAAVGLSCKAASRFDGLAKKAHDRISDRANSDRVNSNMVSIPDYLQLIPVIKKQDLVSEEHIEGPAILIEDTSTVWLKENWQAKCDSYGTLILTRVSEKN